MSDNSPAMPRVRNHVPITKVTTLSELFQHPGLRERMEKIIPDHLNADRMIRTMMNATLKAPKLQEVHPLSMLGAAMVIGYLGLEPNTPLGLVHLIPFEVNKWNPNTRKREFIRTDVNVIIGYQGYIDLIDRGGLVKELDCQNIWPGDNWELERGSNAHFKHVEKFADRLPTVEPDYVYMFARKMNGGEVVELLSKADVHYLRNNSQGWKTAQYALADAKERGKDPMADARYRDAPWVKFAPAMWRKTALRAGQKWLPKSPQLAHAVAIDEATDEGRIRLDSLTEPDQVIEGAWEETTPEGDEEPPVDLAPRDRKTAVQVKTPDPAKAQPTRASAAQAVPARDEPANAARQKPQDDGIPFNRWDDEARQEAPPATTPAGQVAPVEFEAYLLDENGDDPQGPFTHPAAFVSAICAAWEKAFNRLGLIEQNADGIADARAHGMQFAWDDLPEETSAAPPPVVIALDMIRGKPATAPYMKEFERVTADLTPDGFLDFVAANLTALHQLPRAHRMVAAGHLARRAEAIGLALPPVFTAGIVGESPKASPAAEPDAPASDLPPSEDPDLKTARNRIADINACATIHDLEAFGRGIVLKGFGERMEREGKAEILTMVQEAYRARKEQLKPPTLGGTGV